MAEAPPETGGAVYELVLGPVGLPEVVESDERLAQAIRPPAALWITMDLLPINAPIPCLVEM